MKAVEFARNRPKATPAQLVEFTTALANQVLIRAKVPPFTGYRPERISSVWDAKFESWNWDMVVDVDKLVDLARIVGPAPAAVGGLTADQIALLAGSVYHESRHAEQTFRVAQLMARSEHKNAMAIAAELQIPLSIAALAASSWTATAAPADPAAVAQTEGWRAFSAGGRHVDYRRYVVSTKDDLLAVLAVMPRVKDVRAMPGLRRALDLWEQLLTDTKIPEWRENLHTFKDAKQPTLDTAHVPVDADVATSLGHIIADMAHLFGAAQRLRTLQARQATAADIDAAEEELQDKLFAAFMIVANAEQAFPEEQDARAAGDAVAAAVRTVYARPAPRRAP